MRIDLNVRVPDAPDSAPAKANAPAEDSHGGIAADTAKLSTGGTRVEALSAQVSQMPEMRQEKVAALAQQIQAGSYPTTPAQTAEAMMGHLGIAPFA